ncbi:LTA synthase family protein [Ancylomarina euxinus]|uniref:LTA synthase family protein n=1 Tax=Ancylomarina euxinus TaxID=2283627 RepID=A0A425Y044_9BACT|nr:LTA synthase family protein [Ancylomarina euxinus]MCZ4695195.1 LTA synthase family protein [Ancylomarina euxinus]MUP15392.1 sulfatase-like hydrolase/transferase [Ancylomarina euxinus]RRG21102.1 LTA synthase family protein [Ancylomarina euxinus]
MQLRINTKSKLKVLSYQLLLLMFLFQLSRLLFIGFNQALFSNTDWYQYPFYIIDGIKFDLAAVCMINTPFILLCLLPFRWCENKWYQYVLMAIYALTSTIALVANLADIFYYPYTLKRLTFSIFDYLGTQANMSSLGGEFFFTYWYAFVLLGLLVFILIRFFLFTLTKRVKTQREFNYKTALAVCLSVLFLCIAGIKNNLNIFGDSLEIKDAIQDVEQVEDAGIVLNSAFTLLASYFEKAPIKAYSQEMPVSSKLKAESKLLNKKAFRPDNVVIIILESFTKETFKSLNPNLENGNYPGYAPFLDSLMHESLYFTNAYANGRKSMDALPAIISSIPASQTPFILSNKPAEKVPGLAFCLKQKGYETMFFHGSHNATMGFADYCKAADIDTYYGLNEYPYTNDFDGTWGIFDEPYLNYMAKELNQCKKPFLATVFTLSSHNPYVVPAKYKGIFPKGTDGIHETMNYTDHALRLFFKTAAEMPWYKNTLFVITADHAITPWHKEYATSANAFAIPLMFYAPGKDLKGKREECAQQIDIFPTVLNYLNYDQDFRSAGHDLLDPNSEKFAISIINQCYQMIQDDYLLLFDGKECKALYQIKNDPFQKNNLIQKETEQINIMLLILRNWIKNYTAKYI